MFGACLLPSLSWPHPPFNQLRAIAINQGGKHPAAHFAYISSVHFKRPATRVMPFPISVHHCIQHLGRLIPSSSSITHKAYKNPHHMNSEWPLKNIGPLSFHMRIMIRLLTEGSLTGVWLVFILSYNHTQNPWASLCLLDDGKEEGWRERRRNHTQPERTPKPPLNHMSHQSNKPPWRRGWGLGLVKPSKLHTLELDYECADPLTFRAQP